MVSETLVFGFGRPVRVGPENGPPVLEVLDLLVLGSGRPAGVAPESGPPVLEVPAPLQEESAASRGIPVSALSGRGRLGVHPPSLFPSGDQHLDDLVPSL